MCILQDTNMSQIFKKHVNISEHQYLKNFCLSRNVFLLMKTMSLTGFEPAFSDPKSDALPIRPQALANVISGMFPFI